MISDQVSFVTHGAHCSILKSDLSSLAATPPAFLVVFLLPITLKGCALLMYVTACLCREQVDRQLLAAWALDFEGSIILRLS